MSSTATQTLFYIPFCLLFVLNYLTIQVRIVSRDPFKTLCISSIIWSLFLFITTEFLSLFNAISRLCLLIAWLVIMAVELAYLVRKKDELCSYLGHIFRRIKKVVTFDGYSHLEVVLLAVIIFLLVRMSFVAVNTVPNNWDSMSYHLSRIMYWIEHGNVNYYDTWTPRQLYSPVFAEYINLHVIKIAHGDKYVNMVQNFGGYGCVILVYGLIRRMKASRMTGLLGCLVMISMNIFMAESISTQNDIIGGYYLVIYVYLLVDVMYNKEYRINKNCFFDFFTIGCAFGFLYLTKSNACVPALVITLFVIAVKLIDRMSLLKVLELGAVSALSALVLAVPTLIRNYLYVGDILAKDYMGEITIGTLNPSYVFVNVLKNLCCCAVNNWNQTELFNNTTKIATLLHANIDAPEISFSSIKFSLRYSFLMDYAGAPILVVLLAVGMVLAIWLIIVDHDRTSFLNVVLILQFVSSLIVIRWQPWVTRLLLPSLILSCIPAVIGLYKFGEKIICRSKIFCPARIIAVTVFCTICVSGVGEAFSYHEEPVRSYLMKTSNRFDLYFKYGVDSAPYDAMCNLIDQNGYTSVGLLTGDGSYQYPVLQKYVFNGVPVENVCFKEYVKTDGSIINIEYFNTWFQPDCILVADVGLMMDRNYICNGNEYHCIYEDNNQKYSLWVK